MKTRISFKAENVFKNAWYSLCLLLVMQTAAYAQTEFIVTVDPAMGTHHIIDDLPPVNYIYVEASSYDRNGKRFIFRGRDFGGADHLYTIDVLTGAILHQPVIALNTGEFEYDNVSNRLFAIDVDLATGATSLVSLDLATGVPTLVTTLPFSGFTTGSTCLDETTNSYLIQHSGNLYKINLGTGAIATVPAPMAYNELRMDNTTGYAYGLIFIGGYMQLVRIDPATGSYTTVSVLSGGLSTGQTTLDEIGQHYIFNAMGYLASIDLSTGFVVSDPAFPVGLTPPQNVIELHCDNATGIIYALHWGEEQQSTAVQSVDAHTGFALYPNPASETVTLDFGRSFPRLDVKVYDATGRLVVESRSVSVSQVMLNTGNLGKGMYLLQVIADGKSMPAAKLMVK